MGLKGKLFLLYLILAFIPVLLAAYATNFFTYVTPGWISQVFMSVSIFVFLFAGIFAFITAEFIIDPNFRDTETALIKAVKELEKATALAQQEKAADEALLNNIGDAVVAVDRQRTVIFINDVAANMIGWKRDEVVGKMWGRDIPKVVDEQGNSIPRENRSIYKAWQTRQRAHVSHYYYIRKDSTRFPVSITAAPIITNDIITGAIVVFRDVTKEKEIDRMKTEFISLASHQLRTPLSAIKWYLRMLLDGDAGKMVAEQEEFVRIIDDSNERMISLVNDLLNISRIESGRIIVEPHPSSIADLVKGVIEELTMKFHEKEQEFRMDIDETLPMINIDPQLIRHVYLNLISNAVKYTPVRGKVFLKITQTADEVISEVQDTGYGIPKDQHSKIFQKFFRAENIARYETDGTGLGLYLVKAIIDSSKGKIWFDSDEGKGTTFWFSLPKSGMIAQKGQVSLD